MLAVACASKHEFKLYTLNFVEFSAWIADLIFIPSLRFLLDHHHPILLLSIQAI